MQQVARPQSLLEALRRAVVTLFSPRRGRGAPVPLTPRPVSPLSAPTPETVPGGPDTGTEPQDPFAPFAALLGRPLPLPPALEVDGAGDSHPEDEPWATRTLDHFSRHHPSPATAPSLSLEALSLVAEPEPDLQALVRLVSLDPALSAGVVACANSAQFRGVDELETVREAVVRLGMNEAARVIGALAARSLFHPRLRSERNTYAAEAAELYGRAVAVANASAALALRTRGARADRAFLGGMLFDVGRAVGLRSFSALALEDGAPAAPECIARVLEAHHVEIGVACHKAWGLPQYLLDLATLHHDEEVPAEPDFVDLHVVRLCGALLDLRAPQTASRASREILQSAQALRLSPRQVRVVDAELSTALQRAETLRAAAVTHAR